MKKEYKKISKAKKKQNKKRYGISKYRSSVPRTIQIATKRQKSGTFKFSLNQTWINDPSSYVATGNKIEFLHFRANSILNCHMPTQVSVNSQWTSQDPTKYNNQIPSAVSQSVDGLALYQHLYQHFVVTGSKISVQYQAVGSGVPSTLFIVKHGVTNVVNQNTTAAKLNELPYTKRSAITTTALATGGQSANCRLSHTYSAKSFEGIKDPTSSSVLRGNFPAPGLTPPYAGLTPSEQTYYSVALAPIDPIATGDMPQGIFRIKVEYVCKVMEPTINNDLIR
ncbi:MAG: putative capsid protein [Circoviridae sp.]|nr:MAG: putative capsid protein [Circoviridae sp.]